jgi:probable rRNA maturation factor
LSLIDKIEFFCENIKSFPFPEHKIREWIVCIIECENNSPGFINIIFCDDDYLYKMNNDYLNHKTLTDIITFDYSAEFGNISGDIFISVERVKENAKKFKVSFINELIRIIGHGVLHLMGYEDKHVDEKTLMTTKEDYYVNLFFENYK